MKKTKIFFCFFLVLLLLFNFAWAKRPDKTDNVIKTTEAEQKKDSPQTESSKPEIVVEPEKFAPQPATYKLITDVLDGFGGQKYNGGCGINIFAGGQSSAIGFGSSTNYNLYAGFVYHTQVNCGDVNVDGIIDIGDIVFCINYVFYSGPTPDPLESGDVNCDEIVDIGDIVYAINYVFYSGPAPVCP
jgi:hypothetical protein